MQTRFACLLLAIAFFSVWNAAAQEQPVTVMPPPLRRIEPPPVTATAAELETRGDSLRVEKAFLDSLDYYQAALKKIPSGTSPAVLLNKAGIAYLQLTRYKDAKKYFERALKADKTYAEAYNNLGVISYIQKKYGRAVKHYRKALELREDAASFHSNLGTAYFARREFDKAIAEYNRALQLDPEVFDRRSQAGIAAQMSSPEDRAHYSYVLAKMYANAGNLDKALLYLRHAMEDGYKDLQNVYKEDEFANLRKDPRFAELMAAKPPAIPQ